ncbi:hypothetical protein AA105894_2594 [Asaia spathodeae NBRC 105894]|nr:hypothetical protein AA105894_2594 [Asaia spathodeae NBRC 105894]
MSANAAAAWTDGESAVVIKQSATKDRVTKNTGRETDSMATYMVRTRRNCYVSFCFRAND